MGWLWSSPAAPAPADAKSAPAAAASSSSPAAPTPSSSSATTNPPSKPSQPPDSADQEMSKLISEFQAEFGTSSSSSPSSSTAAQQQDPNDPNKHRLLDPVGEAILPTEMSCRSAFDRAYQCNGLGGQWTSVYRTGGMRSCSELWDEFWFCMRARGYSPEQRASSVADFYRQRELRRYGTTNAAATAAATATEGDNNNSSSSSGEEQPQQRIRAGPSSQDVWEARTERVAPGTVFNLPYALPDIDDEEWRALEIRRRRHVQEALRREEEDSRRRGDGQ